MEFINFNSVYTLILFSMRLSPVLFMSPVIGSGYVPSVAKIILSLCLSGAVVSAMGWSIELPISVYAMTFYILLELFIGIVLSFGIYAVFGALSLGGKLLDTQMGLGMANMLDPSSKQTSSMFGVILNLLAVMYVYSINGHHMLLEGLVFSVETWPLGSPLLALNISAVIAQFGWVFSFGLTCMAPIIFILFFIEVGIALMARSMPQFNAFLVSIPAKIGIGLLLLAVLLPMYGGVLELWFTGLLRFWGELLD